MEISKIHLQVIQAGQCRFDEMVSTPLELGRRRIEHPGVYEVFSTGGGFRMGIVDSEAAAMPRSAVRVRVQDGGVVIENIHSQLEIFYRPPHAADHDRASLSPGQSASVGRCGMVVLPAGIEVSMDLDTAPAGQTPPEPSRGGSGSQFRTVQFTLSDSPNQSLNKILSASGSIVAKSRRLTTSKPTVVDTAADSAESLPATESHSDSDSARMAVALVAQALDVLRRDIGSEEFLVAAAEAVASMIDLDETCVVTRAGDRWRVEARFDAAAARDTDSDAGPRAMVKRSPDVLPTGCNYLIPQVLERKETIIFEPDGYRMAEMGSIQILDRAVAGPLLGPTGDVIGVLYGHRRAVVDREDQPIGDLEAKLLDLMAGAVSSALNQRRELLIRGDMERFFPPRSRGVCETVKTCWAAAMRR